jgi:acetyl esterase
MPRTTRPRPKPPLIARVIWRIPLITGPRLATATAAQLEKQQERTRAKADRLGPSTYQRVIDGPAGDITLRTHTPTAGAWGQHAVIVHFHGGGWVSGSPREADFICSTVAEGTGAIVVPIDYPHAPRDRYPAGLDDCYAALVWVDWHAAELGGDATRLGCSARARAATLPRSSPCSPETVVARWSVTKGCCTRRSTPR